MLSALSLLPLRPLRQALLAVLLIALGTGNAFGAVGDPSKAGAYCPVPKAGEIPQCFVPVKAKYGDFIDAIDAGTIDAAQLAVVERKLQNGGDAGDAYLALSSLAYGYFRLAERAAALEQPDPVLVGRLRRWNALLTSAYRNAQAKPAFRIAVRTAALDLHARAPAVATKCEPGANGEGCQTTGLLLRTLRGLDDPAAQRGVRGALGHLLGRILEAEHGPNPAELEPVPDPDTLDHSGKSGESQ